MSLHSRGQVRWRSWGCAVSEVVGICLLSPWPRPSTALGLFEEGWRSWRLQQVLPLGSGPLAQSSCTVLGAWLCSWEGRAWPPSKYLHLGGILGLVNYTGISGLFQGIAEIPACFQGKLSFSLHLCTNQCGNTPADFSILLFLQPILFIGQDICSMKFMFALSLLSETEGCPFCAQLFNVF